MKLKLHLIFLFLYLVAGTVRSKDDKYVRIALDANWKQTSIPMEVRYVKSLFIVS